MRRGGRDESLMVGNTWTPPTVRQTFEKYLSVWGELVEREHRDGRLPDPAEEDPS
jgi:hypothetical protein